MANYLELALQHLNEVGAAVLAHGPSADGTEYVVILDKGIKGGPKHRVALSILNSLAQKPKPQPKAEPAEAWPQPKAEPEPEQAASWQPVTHSDLKDASYRELQAMAMTAGIPANQNRVELIAALEELSDAD